MLDRIGILAPHERYLSMHHLNWRNHEKLPPVDMLLQTGVIEPNPAAPSLLLLGDSRAVQLNHHRAQGRLPRRPRHGVPYRPHPQLHAALLLLRARVV